MYTKHVWVSWRGLKPICAHTCRLHHTSPTLLHYSYSLCSRFITSTKFVYMQHDAWYCTCPEHSMPTVEKITVL